MSNFPKRRQPRRGRHLDPMRVADIIRADPHLSALDEMLRGYGYTRQDFTIPYLAKDGLLTLRFVWRRRRDGRCAKHEEVFRFPLSELAGNTAHAAVPA